MQEEIQTKWDDLGGAFRGDGLADYLDWTDWHDYCVYLIGPIFGF
jgi:hypothetical protein